MAQSVLIIGNSGSGKSTSLRNLDPKETFIINPANKSLPFKGWKKKYTVFSKENTKGNMALYNTAQGILKCMQYVSDKMPHIKVLIVDDFQFMSAFEFYDRAHEKGFDKFTQIATNLAAASRLPMSLRDDLYIFFMTHPEEVDINGVKHVKAKTLGKMVDNSLTLEGLYSVVLFCSAVKQKDESIVYGFSTQTDGANTCKSPMGMFDDSFIPNDIKYVLDCMIAYEND